MATVVTRTLTGKDVFDVVAIKANKEEYEDLYGILVVSVTNYIWGAGGAGGAADAGRVDIRVPKYNPLTDTPVVDNVKLTADQGTTVVSKEYRFAINKGAVPPSANEEPDGTWDLLLCKYELPFDTALSLALTVTYTLTFTDLTPP